MTERTLLWISAVLFFASAMVPVALILMAAAVRP